MKFLLLTILFSGCINAQTPVPAVVKSCDDKVQFVGEFTYKKRVKGSKEIQVFKEKGPLKNTWEGNDQAYETLFVKGLDFTKVTLDKIHKEKNVSSESFSAVKDGELQKIDKLDFSKYVLGTEKPFKLKFSFIHNDKIVCHKEILILIGD